MLLPHFLERVYDKPFGQLATEFLLEPLDLNLMNPKPPQDQLALDVQHVQEGSPLAVLGFRSLRVPPDPTLPPEKRRPPAGFSPLPNTVRGVSAC